MSAGEKGLHFQGTVGGRGHSDDRRHGRRGFVFLPCTTDISDPCAGLLRDLEAEDEESTLSARGEEHTLSARGEEGTLSAQDRNGLEPGNTADPTSPSRTHEDPRDVQEAAARLASLSWSRVLRPPIKRGGHVVVDLCAATAGGARGEAVRQIVSRLGSERELGGRAAYRLARGLRWGDLWPAGYQAKLPMLQRRDRAE